MSGLDAKADTEGFLVAYPEGVGNQFKALTCGEVPGAGHVWFGADTGEPADPKPVLDAADVMWDFFAAHPRRAA